MRKRHAYVGVDVVRCRRNGLANAPFPLPIRARRTLSPWTACCRTWLCGGCCDVRQSCLNLLPYVGPGWYPKVSLAAMLEREKGFLWQSLTSLEMQPGAKLRRISRGLYFAATRLDAAF